MSHRNLIFSLAIAAGIANAQTTTGQPPVPNSAPAETIVPAPVVESVPIQREGAPGVVELDRVVAIVNDDVIVMSELDDRMRKVVAQLRQGGTSPPGKEVLEKQVLDRLVIDRVQLQIADRNGIRIDNETLNRAVGQVAKQNKMTLAQFREALESDGYSYASLRQDIRDELIISRVQQQQLRDRIEVTPREVEKFLSTEKVAGPRPSEYRLSHILIGLPEAASPEQIAVARQKTAKVLETLRGGADFAQMAASVSNDQSALRGGDLGWRPVAQLPPPIAKAIAELEKGEITLPIRSANGYHIIKVMDARGEQRAMINQSKVRHILLRTTPGAADGNFDLDSQARLKKLKERIEGGESFGDLARANSDDTASAVKGGELGWVGPGETVPDFERAVGELEPGQVTEPFRTEYGWHIAQLLERREQDGADEIRRNQAREAIRKRKGEEELRTWLRQLRDESYVEYRLAE